MKKWKKWIKDLETGARAYGNVVGFAVNTEVGLADGILLIITNGV